MAENCWVIVPAYNECARIGEVVASIVNRGYPVAVVDDGSTDATAELAGCEGAHVVRHPINCGQGAALQTGIEFALAMGADYIVTFDGDGQHSTADLDGMLTPLVSGEVHFTLGSRSLGRAIDMPWSRTLVLRAATWFTRLVTPMPITDTHNGFRGMTRHAAQFIQLRQHRMAHASEILEQIMRSGLRFKEVPVTVR